MEQLLGDLTDAMRELVQMEQCLQSGKMSNDLLTNILDTRNRLDQLKSMLEASHKARVDGNNNVVAQDGSIIINLVTGSSEAPPKGDFAGYLNGVYTKSERLNLSDIEPDSSDGKGGHFSLDTVYVALMTLKREGREKTDHKESLAENAPVSALALLNQTKKLVLLGGPGSGKTTFANYLALCLAGEGLGKSSANLTTLTSPLPDEDGEDKKERQPWDHGSLLPVPIVLRDFAARGGLPPTGEPGRAEHLWNFLRLELDKTGKGDFFDTLKATLEGKDGGLVLFDGLDEAPDAHQRRTQVIQAVQEFCDGLPYCRVLVTSRTYAYQNQGWELVGFAEALLAPLGDGQVRRFAKSWYRESAVRGRVAEDLSKQRAELLERAVFRNPRIRDLVNSPLLLTMAANLHAHRQGELPDRRHVLYEEILKMLLEVWERRRVVLDEGGQPKPEYSLCEALDVGMDKIRSALQKTAYEVHAGQPDIQGTGDVPEGLLLKNLTHLREDFKDRPLLLINYLRDRSGILAEHGEGVYRFPHRSLQEYLAACYLNDDDYPDNVSELARSDPDRWREVALLAGARAGVSSIGLWGLVQALYCEEEGAAQDAADHWGGFLAGQLLAESGRLVGLAPPKRYAALIKGLHTLHAEHLLKSSVLPARDRVAASRLLPILGGERVETLNPDAMPFCWVPKGPFSMGSDDDPEAYSDEKPSRRQQVDYGYWLARWPVTTAQFSTFVAAEGYQKHDPDSLNGSPGAPVAHVSRHDAVAFCRWLEKRWQDKGWLPAGYHVGLPSELEWEKAARGGEMIPDPAVLVACAPDRLPQVEADHKNKNSMRVYPWGDNPDLERANYDMHIGEVSPVGCYPAGTSPYGCEEMAGNVLEWTRSLWKAKYPYPETEKERRSREDPAADGCRVLRGGGFFFNSGYVRCAYRFHNVPDDRSYRFGFRVVLSPFPLDSEASDL